MDVYGIITDKIINLLEQGVIPWRKPWSSTRLPRNLVSKQRYKGINHFLLSATKYVSPLWLTMHQANQLGGHVRRGEESTIVISWKLKESEESQDDEAQENDEGNRRRLLLRYYRVFNLEQCELPASFSTSYRRSRLANTHQSANVRRLSVVCRTHQRSFTPVRRLLTVPRLTE